MKDNFQDFYQGKPLEIPPTKALEKIQQQNAIANVFGDYLPLSCHVVPYKEKSIWYSVAQGPAGLHPSHFEIYYGKAQTRLMSIEKSLEKAARTRKPVVAGRGSFMDAFFPVLHAGRCQAVIVCGAFLKETLAEAGIEKQWRDLTGRALVKGSPEFLAFARVALATPVLSTKAQQALFRLMQILSQIYFTDRDPIPLLEEIEDLKSSVFAREVPQRMWNYMEVKRDRLLWWHWSGDKVQPWDQRDFGLERPPNTALAVSLGTGRAGPRDELSDMARTARLQRLCFQLCREVPNTLSGPMQMAGAYFLTYADPGANGKKGKAWLRELSGRISRFLQDRLQAPVTIGVGRIPAIVEEIPESFRESEMALHMGVHLGRSPFFYEELERQGRGMAPDLWELSRHMVAAFARLELKEAPLLRDKFVEEALRVTGQRLETLRTHFQYVYFLFLDILRKRAVTSEARIGELSKTLQEGLHQCSSMPMLLAHFRSTLETFTSFFRAPAQGENQFNLNRVRDYLTHHLEEPPNLAQAAKESGYSPSRFSKLFKNKAGIPFSDYLLELRLEKARRFLSEGGLPITQVAQECGFKTATYFIQCFKRKYGLTPKTFRHKST